MTNMTCTNNPINNSFKLTIKSYNYYIIDKDDFLFRKYIYARLLYKRNLDGRLIAN